MPTLRSEPVSAKEGGDAVLRLLCWILALAIAALVVGVLIMPGGGRPREASSRIKCSSNLRQIGLAMKMYANENGGVYPPSLGVVLATQEISADVFVCPSAGDVTIAHTAVPAEPNKPQLTATVNADLAPQIDDPNGHHCSYLYAGSGMNESTTKDDDVIAFEMPSDHNEDGMNILYGDGHIDWMAVGETGPGRAAFDQFLADFKAGKRPLRDWMTPATQPTTQPAVAP